MITGQVLDATGQPITGASVSIRIGCSSYRSATTGPDGVYQVVSIAPATYRARASATGYVTEYWTSLGGTLDCSQGESIVADLDVVNDDIDFILARPGTISGTVRDRSGQPIPNAAVSATRVGCCGSGSTTANALGQYAIANLPAGEYTLSAEHGQFQLEYFTQAGGTTVAGAAESVAVADDGETGGVDFELSKLGTISGRITDSAGAPVAGATVYYYGPSCSHGCSGANTGTDGSYTIASLRPGDYRLRAAKSGFASEYWTSDGGSLDSAAAHLVPAVLDTVTSPIDFALERPSTIAGTVRDTFGNPLGGAVVSANRSSCCGSGSATTDASGHYVISNLPAGSYRVQASRQLFIGEYHTSTGGVANGNLADLVTVTETTAPSAVDFSLTALGILSGTVRDSQGNPVEGATIRYYGPSCNGCEGATSNAAGAYTVHGLLAGGYKLRAEKAGLVAEYYTATGGVADGSLADVIAAIYDETRSGYDFSLATPGSITGLVLNSQGSPIAGASVSAERVPCCGSGVAASNALGQYTIAGLGEGTYRVRASAGSHVAEYFTAVGGTSSSAAADLVPVVTAGTTSGVDFSLGQLGVVSGIIRDNQGAAIAGATIRYWGPGCSGCTGGQSAADGTYRLSGLQVGLFRLQAEKSGFVSEYYTTSGGTTDFSLTSLVVSAVDVETEQVNFALDRLGYISGMVLDSEGEPIAGATVSVSRTICCGSGSATTAVDGSFTVVNLPPGSYVASAVASGYAREWHDEADAESSATEVVVLEAAATASVDFTLTGVPVLTVLPTNLNLTTQPGSSSEDVVWQITNTGQGTATGVIIQPPAYISWVTASEVSLGDIPAGESRTVDFTAAPDDSVARGNYRDVVRATAANFFGQATASLNVTVEPSIRGDLLVRVLKENGEPISSASARVTAYDSTVSFNSGNISYSFDKANGQTNALGEKTFAGLAGGGYVYSISAGGYQPQEGLASVVAGTSVVEVHLVASPLDIDFSVEKVSVEDQYEVNLEITYAADLPVPRLAADPLYFCWDFATNPTYAETVRVYNPSRLRISDIQLSDLAFSSSLQFANEGYLGTLEAGESRSIGLTASGPSGNGQDGVIAISGTYLAVDPSTITQENPEGIETTYSVSTIVGVLLCPPPPPPPPPTVPTLVVTPDRDCVAADSAGVVDRAFRVTNVGSFTISNVGVSLELPGNPGVSISLDATSLGSLAAGEARDVVYHVASTNDAQGVTIRVTGDYSQPSSGSTSDTLVVTKCASGPPSTPPSGGTCQAVEGPFGLRISCGSVGPPPPPQLLQCYVNLDCVRTIVKLELDQQVTLEREAFRATLKLGNSTPGPATNVQASIIVLDEDGDVVTGRFVIAAPTLEGIASDGTLAALTSGQMQWLLGAGEGAAGSAPRRYLVQARISYDLGGSHFDIDSERVPIDVNPEPRLVIDYYLPSLVRNSEEFRMGFTIENTGAGTARGVTLDSGQPRIVQNNSGALLDFHVVNCQVLGGGSSATLTVPIGDVAAGATARGYCTLFVDADGQFLEFSASYKHLGVAGLALPSLIQSVSAHILEPPPLAEGCGLPPRFLLDRDEDGTFEGLFSFETIEALDLVDSTGPLSVDIANGRIVVRNSPGSKPTLTFVDEPPELETKLILGVTADGSSLCGEQFARGPRATVPSASPAVFRAPEGVYIVADPAVEYVIEYSVPPPPPEAAPLYLAAGDSIAAGADIGADRNSFAYPSVLAELWKADRRYYRTENIAVSGTSTGEFLSESQCVPAGDCQSQIAKILERKPKVLTITLGADDCLDYLFDVDFDGLGTERYTRFAVECASGSIERETFTRLRTNYREILRQIAETPEIETVYVTGLYNPFGGDLVLRGAHYLLEPTITQGNVLLQQEVALANATANKFVFVDIHAPFVGHEYGSSCSYIQRGPANNLIEASFSAALSAHPNMAGQRAIARAIARKPALPCEPGLVNTSDVNARLAQLYSPRLFIDGDDYLPSSVDVLRDNAELRTSQGDQFYDAPAPFHDASRQREDYLRFRHSSSPEVYYVVHHRSDGIYLQYWFFYYYNEFVNDHEGDWEVVQLKLDKGGQPIELSFSQHERGQRVLWESVPKDELTHFRVHVASGSHANYFASGRNYLSGLTVGNAFDVASANSVGTLGPDQLMPLGSSITNFGGKWGEVCDWLCTALHLDHCIGGCSGPSGPQRKAVWASDDLGWPAWDFATRVVVHSPVQLHIFDSGGRHVGIANGSPQIEIEGATYSELPDGSTEILLPNTPLDGLRISMDGLADGKAGLELHGILRSESVDLEAKYADFNVAVGSNTSLTVTNSTDLNLTTTTSSGQDQVPPTEVVVTPLDETPPVVNVSVTGQESNGWFTGPATVEITSSDDSGAPVRNYIQLPSDETLEVGGAGLSIESDGVIEGSVVGLDEAGNASAPQALIVRIDRTPPEASFEVSAFGSSIRFRDTSVDRTSGVRSIEWAFGDGATSSEVDPTHVYTASGSYDVTLTVIDIAGNSASTSQIIEVLEAATESPIATETPTTTATETGTPTATPSETSTPTETPTITPTIESCVNDLDCDSVLDATDNCQDVANPSQLNTDRDWLDLPPQIPFDDLTWPNSDRAGDACDEDDDNDGLTDDRESEGAPCASASGPTDAMVRDTDGDRFLDGAECTHRTDPANSASKPVVGRASDSDRDGLPLWVEEAIGSNAAAFDTDSDGFGDGLEVNFFNSSPLMKNTDGDATGDGREIASVNEDRIVNSADQMLVAIHYGPGSSAAYVYELDLNRDGAINSADMLYLAKQYGSD